MPHNAVISATLIGKKTCIFYLHIQAEGLESCFDTFITHCSSKSDNNVKIILKIVFRHSVGNRYEYYNSLSTSNYILFFFIFSIS